MAMDIVENILRIATVGLRFIRKVWRWRLRIFVDAIACPLFVYITFLLICRFIIFFCIYVE